MTDDELTNMLACADRRGTDAEEWNRISVRMLVGEVRRLRIERDNVRTTLATACRDIDGAITRLGEEPGKCSLENAVSRALCTIDTLTAVLVTASLERVAAERDRDAALSCYRGACANREEVAGERDGLRAKVERLGMALAWIADKSRDVAAANVAREALAETGDGNG